MAQPSIARLGHVGIHAFDIEKERAFYQDMLGLQVTDEEPKMGMVFMSSRPEEEHPPSEQTRNRLRTGR